MTRENLVNMLASTYGVETAYLNLIDISIYIDINFHKLQEHFGRKIVFIDCSLSKEQAVNETIFIPAGVTDERLIEIILNNCEVWEINKEELKKKIDEYDFNLFKEQVLHSIKAEAETNRAKIEDYKRRKLELLRDLQNNENSLIEASCFNADKYIEEKSKELLDQFKDMKEHKLVENISYATNTIQIFTKELTMVEPITNRKYRLGKANITMNISKNDVGIKTDNQRKGYWSPSYAPHCGVYNRPCLGTAMTPFAQYMTEKNYYLAMCTILNYLQFGVDINDIAGYHISEWDEIDDNGNVIREGHEPTCDEYDGEGATSEGCDARGDYLAECDECGCDIYEDDEYHHCHECDCYICEEHSYWDEETGEYYCRACYDELIEEREREEDE